ncbi:MAG: phenylalanine--tRNA ligase subunit beta [Candidatus Saccharibacteria bacterium]
MKISLTSLKWLNQLYGCSDNSELEEVDDLISKIGAQLGEIDEVINLSERYDGIIVSHVVSCVKHPGADKLHICMIDDGGVAKGVKRDSDGNVQVVCGAPNVKAGLNVAWLPPGSIVPSTYNKENFTLESRELRGKVSNGMLASPAELAFSDNHDGILEIRSEEVGIKNVKPGTPFKNLYGLDDTIIDIENKMFTHRPDCFGMLGVARELAGIQNKKFTSPKWYIEPIKLESKPDPVVKGLTVEVDIPRLVPRYQALIMSGIKVGPSPVWLQTFLSRLGVKSINNIVDMTNYMMLTTGQPLHAFDFDKVAVDGTAHIVVRNPKPKEKLTLLDGKTIEPRKDAILIADKDKTIALGGVMGGNNSEIDDKTTRIIIESANFDMYNIRKTSMEHGLFTDAVTRFNKGQSPWQTEAVLHQAAAMTGEVSPGAHVVGEPVDVKNHLSKNPTVSVGASFINERLGLQLNPIDMKKRLENVEFQVSHHNDQLEVTAPFWRMDIAIPEDIVEEVGRLYGYDHLPLGLPMRDLTPAQTNPQIDFKKHMRNILSRAGANEILTYSFVHRDLLTKTGQDPMLAFELSNALSPELQYFRMSLMPSLLDKVHGNIKAGNDKFALFELNKTHNKLHTDDDHGLPTEINMLALVFAANDKAAKCYDGAPYYQARKYLDYLANQLGLTFTYSPITDANSVDFPVMKPYDLSRSALVGVAGTDIVLGSVGEFRARVRASLKLPAFIAGFEIGPLQLQKAITLSAAVYKQLARYPRTSQDISFKVPANTSYASMSALASDVLAAAALEHGYEWSMDPLDIYRSENGAKHVSFRVTLWKLERTMKTSEVSGVLDAVAEKAKSTLKAERL